MAAKTSADKTDTNAPLSEFVRAEKYFLVIANTTEDIIHLNDLDGRIIYSNHATEKILGYRPDEIINTYAHEIIHPDDRDHVKHDMRTVVINGVVPPRTIRLRKKDGAYLAVEARGFQVVLENGRQCIGAIGRVIPGGGDCGESSGKRIPQPEKALDWTMPASAILPICTFCKNIRDEEGEWLLSRGSGANYAKISNQCHYCN